MNPVHLTEKLKAAPGVKWVVENDGLHIWGQQEKPRFMAYPEAALWDLISRGYRYNELHKMLSHIAELDENQTAKWMHDTVLDWLAAGLLAREKPS